MWNIRMLYLSFLCLCCSDRYHQGASSFGQAWQQGHVVTLPSINSIATSLGATSVTPVALKHTGAHTGGVVSAICTDAEAIDGCVKFAQDHHLLVEPVCGAALAVLYSDRLRNLYLKQDIVMTDALIVVEVCSGSGVSISCTNGSNNKFRYNPNYNNSHNNNNNRPSQIWMGVQRQDNNNKK
jgi:threonine dehydratase